MRRAGPRTGRRVGAAACALLLAACGPGGSNATPGGPEPTPDPAECADAPLRATGTTHHFCDCQAGAAAGCVAGDDTADGLTASTPRRSLPAAVAQFNGMDAGDTVALCRGGAWTTASMHRIENPRCTPASPCDFREYAPPGADGARLPRPVIAATGDTLFLLDGASQGGIRFWSVDTRIPGTMGQHFLLLGGIHDFDLCNWHMTGGYAGVNAQPSIPAASNILIRGNRIASTGFAGFFGGAPGIRITENVFVDNGLLATEAMHSVYLISHCPSDDYSPYCAAGESSSASPDAPEPTSFVFSNNHVRTGSFCAGVMFVVHGTFINNRLVVENNLLETTSTNPACYGVMLSGGLTGALFTGVRFERNRVFAPGNAVELSCCLDCTASGNVAVGGDFVISDSPCGGAFLGARGTYQNNTVFGADAQIRIGARGSGPYHVDSNAIWTERTSCIDGDLAGGRSSGNYCRSAGGASATAVFVDPSNPDPGRADLTPAAGSPLAGQGSATWFAATAIGSRLWDPRDPGILRRTPVDAGAMMR